MFANLLFAIGGAWAAIALWTGSGWVRGLAGGFAVPSFWQLYCAATAARRRPLFIVLRLGGFSWSMEKLLPGLADHGANRDGQKHRGGQCDALADFQELPELGRCLCR